MIRPRLVHVTTTDMSLEWLLGPQLRAFRDAGYEVIGISAPGPFVAKLEADGIRHVPLSHATRGWSLQSDLRAFNELRKLFRELQPDIVHTHNPKPGIYGRLAAKAARVPVIVNTQHGLYATRDDRPPSGRWSTPSNASPPPAPTPSWSRTRRTSRPSPGSASPGASSPSWATASTSIASTPTASIPRR